VAFALLRNKRFLILILLIAELICLPNAFVINRQVLKERSMVANQFKSDPTFPLIKKYLSDKLEATGNKTRVLIDYSEYDDFKFLMTLPVINSSGKQIKYSIRYYNNNFNRNGINYCITKPGEIPTLFESQIMDKIFEHKYFDLYKIHLIN
jgi:hypothetical protein